LTLAGVAQAATLTATSAIGVILDQAKALQVFHHRFNELRGSSQAGCQAMRFKGAAIPNFFDKLFKHT
jgi:hypothetical protein